MRSPRAALCSALPPTPLVFSQHKVFKSEEPSSGSLPLQPPRSQLRERGGEKFLPLRNFCDALPLWRRESYDNGVAAGPSVARIYPLRHPSLLLLRMKDGRLHRARSHRRGRPSAHAPKCYIEVRRASLPVFTAACLGSLPSGQKMWDMKCDLHNIAVNVRRMGLAQEVGDHPSSCSRVSARGP